MRSALPAFALLLSSCNQTTPEAAEPARSFCASRIFEGSRFTSCAAPGGRVEVRTAPRGGQPYRSFAALEQALGARTEQVAFGTNAGMFDEVGAPIGLLVEDGRELKRINRRKGGGNFHLLPNGVFLVRRGGQAQVLPASKYRPAADIQFATQSGPMLLIEGKLHPAFDADGESRHFRNGVGLASDGTPTFVISEEPVSFGKLARFFRDAVGSRDALYFDGAVSSLWDPINGRRDNHAELGPMVVVFRPR